MMSGAKSEVKEFSSPEPGYFSKGDAQQTEVGGNLQPTTDVRINYINGFLLFSVHPVSDLNRLRKELCPTQEAIHYDPLKTGIRK